MSSESGRRDLEGAIIPRALGEIVIVDDDGEQVILDFDRSTAAVCLLLI